MQDYPSLQVLTTLLINLAYLSLVLNCRPYENREDQKLITFNEVIVLLTNILMICFIPGFIEDGK